MGIIAKITFAFYSETLSIPLIRPGILRSLMLLSGSGSVFPTGLPVVHHQARLRWAPTDADNKTVQRMQREHKPHHNTSGQWDLGQGRGVFSKSYFCFKLHNKKHKHFN